MKELMEFVAFADIHAEAHSLYVEDYLKPLETSLAQITRYALDNGIKEVFQAGDIFDNPSPKKSTQIAILKALDLRLNWHIIPGNHEYIYSKKDLDDLDDENAYQLLSYFSDLGALPHINIYLKPTIKKIEGVPFRFLPFPCTSYKKEKEAITFGHFEANGYSLDNGRKIENGYDLDNENLTILGHIHTPQLPLYPGSILQKNFGEEPNKGFFHCTVYKSKGILKLKVKFVPLVLSLVLVNVRVEKEEDLQQLEKYKDSKYKIKLITKSDIVLPSTLLLDNPNIISQQGFKTRTQAIALERGVLIEDKVSVKSLDEFKLLSKFLKNEGLRKKDRKRCKKIISNFV